jgi:hypothetical protein
LKAEPRLAALRRQCDMDQVSTRRRRRRAACALVAAACSVGGTAAPAGAADRVVTANAGPDVDAFRGTFAWADTQGRLVLFSGGLARFPQVRRFGYVGADPALGPGPRGAAVAAYSRCTALAFIATCSRSACAPAASTSCARCQPSIIRRTRSPYGGAISSPACCKRAGGPQEASGSRGPDVRFSAPSHLVLICAAD